MLGCLFCHRKLKLFQISKMHSNTEHPIKNYIIEFLGNCEKYLKDDYGMCCNCVYVLNNLLYIKRFMYLIIATDNYNFAAVYKTFVEQLQKVNYDEEKVDASDNDDNLLQEQRTSPYVEEEEANLNRRQLNTPRSDIEIQAYLNRRKRRRGHGWTKRKRSQSRGTTSLSEPIYRNNPSRAMSGHYSEYQKSEWGYSTDDDTSNFQFPNEKRKHVSDIAKSTKATRTIYTCNQGCTYKSSNLTDLTEHKMKVHKMLAKYACEECYRQRFVSPDDLKAHNDKCHNILISFCLVCSEEMQNIDTLIQHSKKHSYSCMFCDLSFLTRKSLRKHSVRLHKWKRRKPNLNESRKRVISFNKDSNNSTNTTNNLDYEEQIVKRLQKPPSEISHSSLYNDVIEGIFLDDSNHLPDSDISQNANEISDVNNISTEDFSNDEIHVNSSNVCDDVSQLSNDSNESYNNEIENTEMEEDEVIIEQTLEIESSTIEISETCISGEFNSIYENSIDRVISNVKESIKSNYTTPIAEFEKFINQTIENRFESSGLASTSTSPSTEDSQIPHEIQMESSPKSNNKNNLINEKQFSKPDGKL